MGRLISLRALNLDQSRESLPLLRTHTHTQAKMLVNLVAPTEGSKNSMKRLKKHTRMKEKYSEKKRLKREQKKLTANPITPDGPPRWQRDGHPRPTSAERKAMHAEDMEGKSRFGPALLIDCDFTENMTRKEICSLAQQIMFCYSINRRAPRPVRLALSSFGRPDTVGSSQLCAHLQKVEAFEQWLLCRSQAPLADLARNPTDFVYLTADADEDVETFDPDTVYVIGGLVDRNRMKGCTRQKADQLQMRTRRLPLER